MRQRVLSASLIVVFIFVYLSKVLLSPANYLPGDSRHSDFTFNFLVWRTQLRFLASGQLPFGVIWVHSYYGGFPVSVLPFNGWEDLPNTIGTGVFAIFGDSVLALRLMVVGSFLLSGLLAYLYAGRFISETDGKLLASVAYSISPIHFTDIYYGHLNLLYGYAFLPLVLYSWERLLSKSNRWSECLALFSLVILFFTEWQVLLFAALFLCLRIGWAVLHGGGERAPILKRSMVILSLFVALSLPLVYPAIRFYLPAASGEFGLPDYMYFVRLWPSNLQQMAAPSQLIFQYAGLSLIGLAAIAIFSSVAKSAEREGSRPITFLWLAGLFFAFYSAANSGMIDIAGFIAKVIPLASSIKGVGRSAIVTYLCFSILGGAGAAWIKRRVFAVRWPFHIGFSKFCIGLLLLLLVFADLSAGFQPFASPLPQLDSKAYSFLSHETGFFRVMVVPQYWGLADVAAPLAGHEIVDYRQLYLRGSSGYSEIYGEMPGIQKDLLVRDGDFETSLYPDWGLQAAAGSHAEISQALSRSGASSMQITLNGSANSYVRLQQNFTDPVSIDTTTLLGLSVYPTDLTNSTLKITVVASNADTGALLNITYSVGRLLPKSYLLSSSLQGGEWNDLRAEIGRSLSSGHWRVLSLVVEAKGAPNDRKTSLYIDNLELFEPGAFLNELTLYAVKYVLLRKYSPNMGQEPLGAMVFADPNTLRYFQLYLTLFANDFRIAYEDNSTIIYQNLLFRGFAFTTNPLKPESAVELTAPNLTGVSWDWTDSNVLTINVSATNEVTLLVSQPFLEGWTVELDGGRWSARSILNVTAIPIPSGTHTVSMRFLYHNAYLSALALDYVALIVSALTLYVLIRKRSRRGLMILCLVSVASGLVLLLYPFAALAMTGFTSDAIAKNAASLLGLVYFAGLVMLGSVAVVGARELFAAQSASSVSGYFEQVLRKLEALKPGSVAWCTLAVIGSISVLASLGYVSKVGPVFVMGTLVGKAFYVADLNRLLSLLGVAILASLGIVGSIRARAGRAFLFSAFIIAAAILSEGKFLASEYVLVAANPWLNELWLYFASFLALMGLVILQRLRIGVELLTRMSRERIIGSTLGLMLLSSIVATIAQSTRPDVGLAFAFDASFLAGTVAIAILIDNMGTIMVRAKSDDQALGLGIGQNKP